MDSLGMRVRIKFSRDGVFKGREQVLRNVAEIHYNYQNSYDGGRIDEDIQIAFESDVHGTGVTYSMRNIEEFEAEAETERAENF